MADDDVGGRERAGQVDRVGELRMEHPRVEGQPERGQAGEARAEVGLLHEVRALGDGAVADHVARVPGRRVAHAAKSAAAGADQRLEHGLDPIAQREIGEADDARGDARRAVLAALAHRRDARDELGLAHRPHLDRAARAVHRVALQEHGRDDVVAGAEIGEQLVQQVAVVGPLPQMMMRVDDRQLGLEDRLGRRLGEPRLVRGTDPSVARRRSAWPMSVRVMAGARPVRVTVVREAARRGLGVVDAGRLKFIDGTVKMRSAAAPSAGTRRRPRLPRRPGHVELETAAVQRNG